MWIIQYHNLHHEIWVNKWVICQLPQWILNWTLHWQNLLKSLNDHVINCVVLFFSDADGQTSNAIWRSITCLSLIFQLEVAQIKCCYSQSLLLHTNWNFLFVIKRYNNSRLQNFAYPTQSATQGKCCLLINASKIIKKLVLNIST